MGGRDSKLWAQQMQRWIPAFAGMTGSKVAIDPINIKRIVIPANAGIQSHRGQRCNAPLAATNTNNR